MTVRHLYWFTYQQPTLPSIRYRALHPLQHLWAWHGVGSTLVVPGRDPLTVLRSLRTYTEALLFPKAGSVIVVQRVHSLGLYAWALRFLTFFRGDRSIYDIDDAEYIERHPATIQSLMRNCALVACGSSGLQDYARRYNPNTLLLTSPVPDHGQRKPAIRGTVRRNAVFTIGWVGCFWGTHEASLRALVYPALRDLGFRVRLVVMGARNDQAEQRLREALAGDPWITIEVERDIPWCDEAAVHARIATFDAGLAPLLDNEINRCKSAFKLKQYLSCGVPVLASPIGENARFLEHGLNGFASHGVAQLRAGIYRLAGVSDPDYSALSNNALRSTDRFDLEHYARTLLKACGELPVFRERRAKGRHPTARLPRTSAGNHGIPQ